MNNLCLKSILLACCLVACSIETTAQTQQDTIKWSAESAESVAQQAVEEGQPFLYSSGGFVCSPKYQSEYRLIALDLPVKSLACGCGLTGVSLRQASYARHFNNQVLALLAQRITQP